MPLRFVCVLQGYREEQAPPYSAYDEKYKWDAVVEKVSSNRRPNPTDLEIAFKNLGFCQHKPRAEKTYYNLDWMCGICKDKELIQGWDPQQMVDIFHACARIGYLNPDMFGAMGKHMLRKKYMSAMNEGHLTTLIYSLGLLGRRGQKDQKLDPCGVFFGVSEVVRGAVMEITNPARLAAMSEFQVGDVWCGLGLLKFYDPEHLLPLAEETISEAQIKRTLSVKNSNVQLVFFTQASHDCT